MQMDEGGIIYTALIERRNKTQEEFEILLKEA